MAVNEGHLVRNVARLVTPPDYTPGERDTWSAAEVRQFLHAATADRLHAAGRLSLYGLRRGEMLGLRWADIDLKGKTLTVDQARVIADLKVRIEEPKSSNGKRTLPLDDELISALTALRKRQARESRPERARPPPPSTRPGLTRSGGTPLATNTWSPMSWVSRFTPSGTPMSSAACSSAPGCARSGSTTPGTPRCP